MSSGDRQMYEKAIRTIMEQRVGQHPINPAPGYGRLRLQSHLDGSRFEGRKGYALAVQTTQSRTWETAGA